MKRIKSIHDLKQGDCLLLKRKGVPYDTFCIVEYKEPAYRRITITYYKWTKLGRKFPQKEHYDYHHVDRLFIDYEYYLLDEKEAQKSKNRITIERL